MDKKDKKDIKSFSFGKLESDDFRKTVDRGEGYAIYKPLPKGTKRTKDKQSGQKIIAAPNQLRLEDSEKEEIIDSVFAPKTPAPKICHICGINIPGDYYRFFYKNKPIEVCFACFSTQPKCENCHLPIKRKLSAASTKYCDYCKPSGECTSCGMPLTSKTSLRLQNQRGIFCQTCVSSAPRCLVCHVPVQIDAFEIDSGVVLCPRCHNFSLATPGQINLFVNDAFDWIGEQLEFNRIKDIKIIACPYGELRSKYNDDINFIKQKDHFALVTYHYINEVDLLKAVGVMYGTLIGSILERKLNRTVNEAMLNSIKRFCSSILLSHYNYNDENYQLRILKDDSQRFYKILLKTFSQSPGKDVIERIIKEIMNA